MVIRADQQVPWLDIAVDQAGRMGRLEPSGRPGDDAHGAGRA